MNWWERVVAFGKEAASHLDSNDLLIASIRCSISTHYFKKIDL